MPSIGTNITPPRVPLIEPKTGLISREWYRFFLGLFQLTSSGSSVLTLDDLQLGPVNHESVLEQDAQLPAAESVDTNKDDALLTALSAKYDALCSCAEAAPSITDYVDIVRRVEALENTPGQDVSSLFASFQKGSWTPSWTGLTTIGAQTTNVGYYFKVGNLIYYSVQLRYSTSFASVLGTSYHTLPFPVAYPGACHAVDTLAPSVAYTEAGLIDSALSIAYVPTVTATSSLISFSGTYYTA